MTQAMREALVERYTAGEMSPAEEQGFLIEAAVNDELRRTLRAYHLVDRAIRRDRDMLPPTCGGWLLRLLDMLRGEQRGHIG